MTKTILIFLGRGIMTKFDLKETLTNLLKEANHEAVTYRTICNALAGKGYPLLLIFLSLPFSTPVSIPGLSTSFGIAIGFIGLRMAFGYHPWWPEWIMKKTISYSLLEKIIKMILRLMDFLQKFSYPRMTFFTIDPILHRIHGLLIFFLGLILALPLPIPLSNIPPALAVLFISLGLLENDGVFIMIGYLLAAICFGIFGVLFWKGVEIFHFYQTK